MERRLLALRLFPRRSREQKGHRGLCGSVASGRRSVQGGDRHRRLRRARCARGPWAFCRRNDVFGSSSGPGRRYRSRRRRRLSLKAWMLSIPAVALLLAACGAAGAGASDAPFPPSIYPKPASFPEWGSPNGCASLKNVAPFDRQQARHQSLQVISEWGQISKWRDLHLSDRAEWPASESTGSTSPNTGRRSTCVQAMSCKGPEGALLTPGLSGTTAEVGSLGGPGGSPSARAPTRAKPIARWILHRRSPSTSCC
jgi:hypothetical protein